jgi:hypothetical protein
MLSESALILIIFPEITIIDIYMIFTMEAFTVIYIVGWFPLAQLRLHSTVCIARTELWEMGTNLLYKWRRKLSNRWSYQLSSTATI